MISIIDFLAAILLFFSLTGDFTFVISLILLSKGIWSMMSSIASGFYYDLLGFIDFLGAILLLIMNFGTPVSFSWVIGALIAAKAIWATMSSI
jgi:hypothetical protein